MISDLVWTKEAKGLASGCFDSTCKIWDIEYNGKQTLSIDTDGFVQSVEFLPEGKLLRSHLEFLFIVLFINLHSSSCDDTHAYLDVIFAYSTSRQWLNLADKRTGATTSSIKNDSVISSM